MYNYKRIYKYKRLLKYRGRKKSPVYSSSYKAYKTPKKRKTNTTLLLRKEAQKLTALSVIFICGLIVLVLAIKAVSLFTGVKISIDDIEAMRIPPVEIEYVYEISKERGIDPNTALTAYCIENRFFKEKRTACTKEQISTGFFPKIDKIINSVPENKYREYYHIIDCVMSEIKAFPVAQGYMFGDTWGIKTNCGEKRHNGTDIFDRENIAGRLPVASMTGGTVAEKNKNKQGNWSIVIKTQKGTHFYYEHLGIIEGVEVGAPVAPGTILGYMGDGGKGYPAKVHIGIKADSQLKKNGIWINPYPFLEWRTQVDTTLMKN